MVWQKVTRVIIRIYMIWGLANGKEPSNTVLN